ncbi:MAG: FAD/FMN-containing dehydrogenase, partial [Gammaproteobacteria bacterium]
NKIKVGIRSGGHSWVYSSIRDNSMLLDLRNFRDLEIDAENMTAIVGPAITARELASKLEEVGLGFPVAHCSTVAMGGYLLGGGQAWNWGSWGGAACNSVKALDIVNAKGEILHIDENNHSDLMWAARGAGPGFPAVVTNYHLKLYPLPKAIHMNNYVWPLADTLAVSKWQTEIGAVLSDKVELFMFLLGLAEPINGVDKVVVITGVAYAETEDEAKTLLAPMSTAKAISTPISVDEIKPMTINSLLDLVDRTYPPCRAAVDTFWFDLTMEEVMEKYVDHFAAAPSHLSNVLCEVKPKPIVIPDTAYSMRRLSYLSPYSFWLDEKDDKENIEWMEKTQEILAPLSVGHYVNEADLSADPSRSERSYDKENWERIKKVKNKYDPKGLFHTYLGHES